ncbi:MAG: hypothetical protein JWO38_543 [Gemmataceae bacterium]|nr:hypothetical protein [Gemmataceae bacterium]
MRGVLAVVVFAGATLTAGADDEKKYTSKDGKFAVAFPTDGKVKTTKQEVGGGLTINMVVAEGKDRAYSVMFMSLPEAAKDVPAKNILDGAEKGAIDKSGGKLIKSKEIEFGKAKHPGRDILVEKDGNKVRTWIIYTDTRIYVVLVGGPKDYASGKEAQAFFDSFEITK